MLKDIQSWEDYSQDRQYAISLGRSPMEAALFSEYVRASRRRTEELLAEAYIEKGEEVLPTYKSPLQVILEPEDERLKNLPVYFRYVGYLLSKNTNDEAALKLGFTRMGLYKILKNLRDISIVLLMTI